MKISRKKNITYLFLVLFLSMKMTGLHAMSHIDEKEHAVQCIICDHTIVDNLTPTITPDLVRLEINAVAFVIQKEITTLYNCVFSRNIFLRELFSRPPPFFK